MDINTAKEVIACLPQGKTSFTYYKDRYAAYILSQVIGEVCDISGLKQSAYSGLLNKPIIKEVMAKSGAGRLHHQQLEMLYSQVAEPFLLTLDTWGHNDREWDQVSRTGYNIVLQLNFSNKHDALFRKLLKPDENHSFKCFDHPVMKKGERDLFRETLAWARIDFDFNTNEALIEELQTDWLRVAKRLLNQVERGRTRFLYNGIRWFPTINRPNFLVFLFLIKPSQSLRRITMRLLRLFNQKQKSYAILAYLLLEITLILRQEHDALRANN